MGQMETELKTVKAEMSAVKAELSAVKADMAKLLKKYDESLTMMKKFGDVPEGSADSDATEDINQGKAFVLGNVVIFRLGYST